jgi:hypothetical protein
LFPDKPFEFNACQNLDTPLLGRSPVRRNVLQSRPSIFIGRQQKLVMFAKQKQQDERARRKLALQV